MALGNFAYRFYVADKEDEIENTGLLMNLLAEELSEFLYTQGFLVKRTWRILMYLLLTLIL